MSSRRTLLQTAGAAAVAAILPKYAAFAGNSAETAHFSLFQGIDADIVHASSSETDWLDLSYNGAAQQTPELRVLLRGPDSLAQLAKRFAENNIGFALRSGGHCFGGFSQHKKIVLDLRRLNSIDINTQNGTVTVGPGTDLGPLYKALAPFDLVVPGGTYASVGVGGHVLGGGFGYFSRKAGMLCDNLLSLKIALASGETVEASPSQHPDLFWACQGGGGGSLGIATQFTFRTTRMGRVHSISLTDTATPQRAARILFNWQHWSRLSPQHTTHLHLTRLTESEFLLNLTGISEGQNRELLMEELAQVFHRTKPIHPNYVRTGHMRDLAKDLYPHGLLTGGEFHARSDYLDKPLPRESVWEFIQTLMQYPPNSTKFVFEALGGAIADKAPHETAFPHRNAEILIQYTGEVRRPEHRAIRRACMNHAARTLAPYVTGGTYVNYPDLSLKNWQKAYWGENFERLQQVKRRYDPGNVFRHAQSVPV